MASNLLFKRSFDAQPFSHMHINSHSSVRLYHRPYFEEEAKANSKMDYCITIFVLQINLCVIEKGQLDNTHWLLKGYTCILLRTVSRVNIANTDMKYCTHKTLQYSRKLQVMVLYPAGHLH